MNQRDGAPGQRALLAAQLRRLAALEETELYQELLAEAAARPKKLMFGDGEAWRS